MSETSKTYFAPGDVIVYRDIYYRSMTGTIIALSNDGQRLYVRTQEYPTRYAVLSRDCVTKTNEPA